MYLKLRTECHSTSYDALTSHMVIVVLRYKILAVERYRNTDERTIEEIFYKVQRMVINEMIDRAVIIILDAFLFSIREYFKASDKQIDELLTSFVNRLPDEWKCRFSLPEAA